MKEYDVAFDCVNQKSYKLKVSGESESLAIRFIFNNDIIIVERDNLVQAIKTDNIVFVEILKANKTN